MGADVSGATQPDYTATKQMVVDILHSPEGKSAVEAILNDPSVKQQMAVNETDIAKAVEKNLETQKNQSFLAQQVKDPQFVSAFAKAAQPELTQINKQLMKDPQYQKDMLILLKSPEFTKNLQDLMQTPEFRGQIMKVMTEALQNPSFRMQFEDALKQAVAQSMQNAGSQKQQSSGGQGGGGDSGGNSSGGGGGGDSG